jgi:hypothetical protein
MRSKRDGGRGEMAQAQAAAAGQVAAKKWVYRFDEGLADMRDLLGGKGAGWVHHHHRSL